MALCMTLSGRYILEDSIVIQQIISLFILPVTKQCSYREPLIWHGQDTERLPECTGHSQV